MRQASPTWQLLRLAVVITALATLSAPAQGTTFTLTSVAVEMSTSEDTLVMNSDVDLTFTVTDVDTGDPLAGCNVTVHIQRRADDDGGDGGHMHGEPREVPAGVPAPSVALEVTPDPKSGWNLHVTTTNFEFAPWNASGEHVWGEGHAHLYVDDVKVGRLYTEWYHLAALEEGTHTIHVTLNGNDHQDLAVDGELVEDTVTIVQGENGNGHGHMQMPKYEVPDGVPAPQVQVTVVPDAKMGWNVRVDTSNFSWAPENASSTPVMGEGHAHLYIDDHKLARVYGGWYHVGSMAEGDHQVRVTLNANNHSDYAKDGVVVESSVTVNVPPGTGDGGHGEGTVTVQAVPGRKAGTYRVTHHFAEAGDYVVEVHIVTADQDVVAKTFELSVLEGDPAPITIAGVILYVSIAVVMIVISQHAWSRWHAGRLQRLSDGAEREDRGQG